MKRIGILTSGGDCAGLNAVLRAVTYGALQKGWEVVGIKKGIYGLLQTPIEYLTLDYSLAGFEGHLLRMGGTILGTTNKGNPFEYKMPDGSNANRAQEIASNLKKLNLDGLIAIGGDGSMKILHQLAKDFDIPLVGIPKTIDNDIGLTDSIGFSTAVSVVTESLDRLQPTAASHGRIMVVEVMGRDAGHIALHSGIAGGADVILLPEIPFNLQKILDHIQTIYKRGRNFALIVVAESAFAEGQKPSAILDKNSGNKRYQGIGHSIGEQITQHVEADVRVTVLGHVQRGGSPDARDRILASTFGIHALDLIKQNRFGRLVTWQNRRVTSVPIEDAIHAYESVNPHGRLVLTARSLGICLGN